MAPEHLGRLPGDGLDLDAHLLAFLGAVDGFVIQLDAGDHADVHELDEDGESETQKRARNRRRPGVAYPFAGDAERRPLPQDAGVDGHAHHDGISGVKDELGQNPQLDREHGDVPEDVRRVSGEGGGAKASPRGLAAPPYLNSSCLAFLYSSLYLVKESNRW